MTPRLGYLCTFDNPTDEAGRALVRQFVLVREADRMGYDHIWIGEQHFDTTRPSASIVALLGHLAAASSKARIGALALQSGLHDPLRLAEDLATIDLLAKGRLDVAVGSGAAFGSALQRFGIKPAAARARALDVLGLVQERLHDDRQLAPRPGQPALPLWIASGDAATLRQAVRQRAGLAAAATHTDARVLAALQHWPQPEQARLVLARFVCPAPTRDEALAIARPYLEAYVAHAKASGWGADAARSCAQDVEALIAQSLIGSYAEVAQQIRRLGTELHADSLALIPTSAHFDTHKHILADMVDEVRPLLDDE